MTEAAAIAILNEAAVQHEEVKGDMLEFVDWMRRTRTRLDTSLLETEPFAPLRNGWVFSGDDGGRDADGLVGDWVIRRIGLQAPELIIAEARAQLTRNRTSVFEVSAVRGSDVDREISLGKGLTLVPSARVPLEWRASPNNQRTPPVDRRGCCVLRQDFTVEPALVTRISKDEPVARVSVTTPTYENRSAARERVRAALLLVSTGAIELPMTAQLADDDVLLADRGIRHGMLSMPFVPTDEMLNGNAVVEGWRALESFAGEEEDALLRAIDRVGRARTDIQESDKALDLGIAAEILFMHGSRGGNSEIRFKFATRAAWLLGTDVAERRIVFDQARSLYDARSNAAHDGRLSRRSAFNSTVADRLIVRALSAILSLGEFPDWESLALGAAPQSNS